MQQWQAAQRWLQIAIIVCLVSGAVVSTVSAQGIPALSDVMIDYATSGDHTLIPGVSGKRIRIYRIFLFCNATNNVIFKDSTPTTLLPVNSYTASQGFVLDVSPFPWFTAALGKDFIVNLSAAQQCSGRAYYTVS